MGLTPHSYPFFKDFIFKIRGFRGFFTYLFDPLAEPLKS